MIVLVSGATATLARHAHAGRFGRLVVPRAGNAVDSIDGRSFSKWPDKYLPLAVRWIGRLEGQPTLSLKAG